MLIVIDGAVMINHLPVEDGQGLVLLTAKRYGLVMYVGVFYALLSQPRLI